MISVTQPSLLRRLFLGVIVAPLNLSVRCSPHGESNKKHVMIVVLVSVLNGFEGGTS
jgi:hypothetical protein